MKTSLLERLATWESFLFVLTVAALTYATLAVPNFVTSFNLSQTIAGASERALIALPMTLLILAREIDISVASILALSSVVFGVAIRDGAPIQIAIVFAMLTGGGYHQRRSRDLAWPPFFGCYAWLVGHVSRNWLHHRRSITPLRCGWGKARGKCRGVLITGWPV